MCGPREGSCSSFWPPLFVCVCAADGALSFEEFKELVVHVNHGASLPPVQNGTAHPHPPFLGTLFVCVRGNHASGAARGRQWSSSPSPHPVLRQSAPHQRSASCHTAPLSSQNQLMSGNHNSGNSPVTGVIDEKLVIIDFGKYEGRSVSEIAEADPVFYDRLASEKENGVFAIRRHRDKTFRLYINPLSNIDH